MKNAYAKKLQIQKIMREKELVQFAIQRDWDIWTIVLNRELGIGRDRLKRLQDVANKVYDEYVDSIETDAEYAETKLAAAVRQIMGE